MMTVVINALWLEVVYPILSAPIWWYTRGLERAMDRYVERFQEGDASLGASVWLTNLFIPMYGQTDWTGRLISFLVRLVQGIARGLIFIIWVLIITLLLGAYICFPLLVVFKLIASWILS